MPAAAGASIVKYSVKWCNRYYERNYFLL